jgi:hypothetical protein
MARCASLRRILRGLTGGGREPHASQSGLACPVGLMRAARLGFPGCSGAVFLGPLYHPSRVTQLGKAEVVKVGRPDLARQPEGRPAGVRHGVAHVLHHPKHRQRIRYLRHQAYHLTCC